MSALHLAPPEVVAEYGLRPVSDNIAIEQAREIRSKLSHACTAIGLADMSGGQVPPRRPSWVHELGTPIRGFPEIEQESETEHSGPGET
jgi:hypothetical protein